MTAPDAQLVAEKASHARGGRLSAAMYDRVLRSGERHGMEQRRRALVSGLSGSVIEIGAGTGLNAPGYPGDLDRLVFCEPEHHMAGRLRARAGELGLEAEVVEAPAEALPFEDATFDHVVGTLVLCTVEDQAASLAEVERVLRPGGRFHFIEHVRADGAGLAKWQDRLHGPWKLFAMGCNCNLPTLDAIAASGLEIEHADHEDWAGVPPVVRPIVVGTAIKR